MCNDAYYLHAAKLGVERKAGCRVVSGLLSYSGGADFTPVRTALATPTCWFGPLIAIQAVKLAHCINHLI